MDPKFVLKKVQEPLIKIVVEFVDREAKLIKGFSVYVIYHLDYNMRRFQSIHAFSIPFACVIE